MNNFIEQFRTGLEPVAVARALEGEVQGGNITCPGPGHSKTDRSLSILIDPKAPDGFRVHSFAGDDWKICRDHVMARLGLKHVRPEQSSPRRQNPPLPGADTLRSEYPLQLWNEARPAQGSMVERYLASRGLTLPTGMDHVIRFHPNCPFRPGERHPCMVALYRHIHTNAPLGIHRTGFNADGAAMKTDGQKIDRKMLGKCGDAAIKLSPDHDVTLGLGIAEGIETALSVMQAGRQPIWAMGSKGGIASLPVLAGIECLSIFADHDFAGMNAAKICAERWHDAGREVHVVMPRIRGADFNDGMRGCYEPYR